MDQVDGCRDREDLKPVQDANPCGCCSAKNRNTRGRERFQNNGNRSDEEVCARRSRHQRTGKGRGVNKSKSGTGRKQRRPIIESEGDWVTANCWIKIGLTKLQVKTLTRLGREWSNSTSPCATAARLLISLGLLNIGETESKLDSLFRYMKAEGFMTLGCYCEGAMRATALSRK